MSWFCLFLKSRLEFIAEKGLKEQDYEVYLPKTIDYRVIKNPKIKPLFPEYMFIKLREGIDDFNPVKFTKGVRCFAPHSEPMAIPNFIIEELKRNEDETGTHELAENAHNIGDSVAIISGPFSMYEAIIHKTVGGRIWVIFDAMGKIPVEVNKMNINALN